MDFSFLVYLFFGVIPSLAWLSYYLRKDLHPEPKKMILKIFMWGAIITVPVYFVQIGLNFVLSIFNISHLVHDPIYWFLIIALSEEFFKFFVIKMKVLNSPDYDEPLDAMLYMVISALGFAAVENILYLFSPAGHLPFNSILDRAVVVIIIRFLGATFLHTLCSSVIGYSLALSFYEKKKKYSYLATGIIMATVLHGLYDFSIITLGGYLKLGVPLAVIFLLAVLVFSGFDRVKKNKSVCEVN